MLAGEVLVVVPLLAAELDGEVAGADGVAGVVDAWVVVFAVLVLKGSTYC